MPIEVGALCDGKVTKITNFGAFVALENGKSGMIHISEISSSFVKDIHDHLSEGQQIRAKVIKIDENGRISLSLKQVEPPKSEPRARSSSGMMPPPAEFEAERPASSSFEDMMSRFKATSDDKMSDLRQSVASKRGSAAKPRRRYDD